MNRTDAIQAAVDAWLRAAIDDAGRRGLADLVPLLEGLARATVRLRAADWNDRVPQGPAGEEGR